MLLQEIFGYCLTFDLRQQKFFLLEGGGGNGKGVVLGVLRALLGPENVSSVSLAGLHARFELASTLGKLANITSESDNVRQVDEAVLKQFTGQDAMQFEKKYRDSFSGVPTAKLIIAVNSRPPFRDRSDGLWRRLILLPFPVGIPEERQNKDLGLPVLHCGCAKGPHTAINAERRRIATGGKSHTPRPFPCERRDCIYVWRKSKDGEYDGDYNESCLCQLPHGHLLT
jgi:hypothetical protein